MNNINLLNFNIIKFDNNLEAKIKTMRRLDGRIALINDSHYGNDYFLAKIRIDYTDKEYYYAKLPTGILIEEEKIGDYLRINKKEDSKNPIVKETEKIGTPIFREVKLYYDNLEGLLASPMSNFPFIKIFIKR